MSKKKKKNSYPLSHFCVQIKPTLVGVCLNTLDSTQSLQSFTSKPLSAKSTLFLSHK